MRVAPAVPGGRPRGMKLSLQQRLFILTGAALLPAVVVFAVSAVQIRSERIAEVNDMALRQAKLASLEVERIVDGLDNLLVAMTLGTALYDIADGTCDNYLARVVANVPSLDSISRLDANGDIVCSSHPEQARSNLAGASPFGKTLSNFTVGTYTESRVTGRKVLPIAVPTTVEQNRAPGILAAEIRLDWLGATLRERGLASGGALTIADRNGMIISRDPDPERFVGTRIPDPYLALVNAAEAGTLEVKSQDGTIRILGYIPVPKMPVGLYVSAGISKDAAFAALNNASLVAVILIVTGALLAFLLAALVGRAFIQRPARRLLETVDAWRRNDLSVRTGLGPGGELETVGAALDAMMEEFQRRNEQRDLASRELSHRVKNTLSIVQAIARQTIGKSADKELSTSFSQRILALAGAYGILFAENWSSSDIRAAIDTTLRPHVDRPDRFRLSGPSVPLPPQAVLSLSMVIHELATNALKYGALQEPGGFVTIDWHAEDECQIRLVWQEHCGPAVVPPKSHGFGSKLISSAFPAEYKPEVDLRYEVTGLVCTLRFELPVDRETIGAPGAKAAS